MAKEPAKRRERTNGERTFQKKGADVNEGKFVLNIDFIMALKPDGLCIYETTKQDSLSFPVASIARDRRRRNFISSVQCML
jgi:hypothetical protein